MLHGCSRVLVLVSHKPNPLNQIQMNAKPDFFAKQDEAHFEAIAPTLAANPFVVAAWGILNMAQCSQDTAQDNGSSWTIDDLACSFEAYVGRLSPQLHQEIAAIWNAGF